MRRSSPKRSRMPPLTMSFRWITPSTRAPSATTSGVPPPRAIFSTCARTFGREATAARGYPARDRVVGALADLAPLEIHAAHARLRREGHEASRRSRGSGARAGRSASFASTTMLRPSGVSSASEASCAASASSAGVTPRRGEELDRLAVAERDRAGLVEQQHVDVARGLDRAPRVGDHVGLDHAVHPGDADRREQTADRGRDQAHEQRHEHRDRHELPLAAGLHGEGREGQQRRGREQEDDRQRGQQDVRARSRWASSGASRLRPARSCGRGRPRPGSRSRAPPASPRARACRP